MPVTEAYSVYRLFIPEVVIPDKRLNRHVNHDSRSLQYQVRAGAQPTTRILWGRSTPILDQGNLGSCTGNAACGCLGCSPFFATLTGLIANGLALDEPEAVTLYSLATQLDSYSGAYPPTDTGSDGLSVAKAAQKNSLISGYQHMTSIDACKTAILTAPFLIGSYWYAGMDNPDAGGVVAPSGIIRGGHEYLCRGYDPTTGLWDLDNSWGSGYGIGGSFKFSDATFTRLLADQGDATQFVPISQPPPTPQPPNPPPATDADQTFINTATFCTRISRPYKRWKAVKGYLAPHDA